MKKLILIFIIGLCAFPARAQWRTLSGWSAWNGLRKSAASAPRVAENVERGVTRALAKTVPPMATHIQITSLADKPLVKLSTPLPVHGGVPGNPFPVLKARVLSAEARADILFPQGWLGNTLYIPSAWPYRDKNFWYRGMLLHNLEELKNILINGLELNKTRRTGIFASSEIASALRYAANDVPVFMALPVLIKIPKTSQLNTPQMPCGLAFFRQDIPADFLVDVMVFLGVDGEPGWYKVTLENGELVFTPVPSRVFEFSELN